MMNICKNCGTKFKVANYNRNRKFCLKICRDKYINKARISKICIICEKEFKCNKSTYRWQVTCSKSCAKENIKKIKINGSSLR